MSGGREVIAALLAESRQTEPPVRLAPLLRLCEVELTYVGPEPLSTALMVAPGGYYLCETPPAVFAAHSCEALLYFQQGRRRLDILSHHIRRREGGTVWGRPRQVTRLRSGIAHELGHLVRHRLTGVGGLHCLTANEAQREHEANEAAAWLLVPDAWLLVTLKRTDDPQRLADLFGVSRQFMSRRLRAVETRQAA